MAKKKSEPTALSPNIRTHLNISGNLVTPLCKHKELIPGLDMSFCPVCKLYYCDEQETDKFYKRKRRLTDE